MSDSGPTSLEALRQAVAGFADQLAATIAAVVPDVDGRFTALVSSEAERERVTLQQHERSGFALTVNGELLLRLVVTYRLSWNGSGEYLAVEKSEFKVFAEGSGVPLLRFDYLRDPAPTIPTAHLNVHAHRDEIVYAMMRAGPRDRGQERARSVAQRRIPSLRELHIPFGGPRFRPCVEDVLQMLLIEFGLDRVAGYQAALDEGRRRYRVQQVRTAASDDLAEVADLLRSNGYSVIPPAVEPTPRVDRLIAY